MKPTELEGLLKILKNDFGMETFLGATLTTQGVFVLLFSHRYNQDAKLVVSGTELEKVSATVNDILGPYIEQGARL